MKAQRIAWWLAGFLAIGLGSYEGLRRYERSAGRPPRTKRERAIDAALDEVEIALTDEDFAEMAESVDTTLNERIAA